METRIKIIPRAVIFANLLFSFCAAILFSQGKSSFLPGVMLVFVIIVLGKNIYDNWGTITLRGQQFEYRRRFGNFHFQCPISAVQKIVIQRGTWYRSKGSVRHVDLILDHEGYRYTVSLGSPFFIGGGALKRARLVSRQLSIPVDDPQLDSMPFKNLPFYKWNVEGKEWKTLLVIFGLAALFIMGGILYKFFKSR